MYWATQQGEANPSYLPQCRPLWRCNAIAFGIQVTSHLHCVARLPLLDVLVHRRLQKVGILPFRLSHPDHALFRGPHKNGGLGRFHVCPHLLKHCYFRALCGAKHKPSKCYTGGGSGDSRLAGVEAYDLALLRKDIYIRGGLMGDFGSE